MGNDNPVTRSDVDESPVPKCNEVSVLAPARLHLGFLDLNGELGRRFGGLGLTIDGIRTRLRVRPARALGGQGPSSARAVGYAERLLEALSIDDGLEISVAEAIPEHVGLGSGTQLALAVGMAVSTLYGLRLAPRDVAARLGRGRRSGIGLAAFEGGGAILDGGQGSGTWTPPVLSRLDIPEAWRLIVVFDHLLQGIHDNDEHEAFQHLPPFPATLSAALCRQVVMGALPALAENDIEQFGGAVSEIQAAMGDFFASVQGHRYFSDAVAGILEELRRDGAVTVGQSSWGPTGFAVVGGETDAARIVKDVTARCAPPAHIELAVCRGRNSGAEIEAIGAAMTDSIAIRVRPAQ